MACDNNTWGDIQWDINPEYWEEEITKTTEKRDKEMTTLNNENMGDILSEYLNIDYTKTGRISGSSKLTSYNPTTKFAALTKAPTNKDTITLKTRDGKHKYVLNNGNSLNMSDCINKSEKKRKNYAFNNLDLKWIFPEEKEMAKNPCGEITLPIKQQITFAEEKPTANIIFQKDDAVVFSINEGKNEVIRFMADGTVQKGSGFTTNQEASKLFFKALSLDWSDKFKKMNKSIIGEREKEILRLEAENERLWRRINLLETKTIRTRNV